MVVFSALNFAISVFHLWQVTEECLERGIAVCKDGAPFRKIGKRIRYIFLPMLLWLKTSGPFRWYMLWLLLAKCQLFHTSQSSWSIKQWTCWKVWFWRGGPICWAWSWDHISFWTIDISLSYVTSPSFWLHLKFGAWYYIRIIGNTMQESVWIHLLHITCTFSGLLILSSKWEECNFKPKVIRDRLTSSWCLGKHKFSKHLLYDKNSTAYILVL